MELTRDVLGMLDDVLSLNGRAQTFSANTPLLGAIPELDSMAVVNLIAAIEERYGVTVDDDEISGDAFASVASLVEFVGAKVNA